MVARSAERQGSTSRGTADRFGTAVLLWLTAVAVSAPRASTHARLLIFALAVVLATWRCGLWVGIGVSVVSAATAQLAWHDWKPTPHPVDWNTPLFLASFVLCAFLADRTRVSLDGARRERAGKDDPPSREAEAAESARDRLAIREAEQRRIGRDLHDGLSQQLTATMLVARLLEEKLMARSMDEAREARQIADLIQDSISLVQHLARGLHPVELSGRGLVGALQHLASSTERLSKIPCSWRWESGEEPSDEVVATHLFRIAQEAVGNALRHARPGSIAIRLAAHGDALVLEVADDGVGLPPDASRSGGLGMRTMRERACALGGVLEVAPVTPHGTRVTCSLRHAPSPPAGIGPHPPPADGHEAAP